jgi:Tripartite tricarboxylate transporter family receptor
MGGNAGPRPKSRPWAALRKTAGGFHRPHLGQFPACAPAFAVRGSNNARDRDAGVSGIAASATIHPTRPVRFISGFPAGGPVDIATRVMADWFSSDLGQQFVVEDRGGMGGNLGTQAMINSPPDGYKLQLVGASNAISASLYKKLPFDFIHDTVPVAGVMLGGQVQILLASASAWLPRAATTRRCAAPAPGSGCLPRRLIAALMRRAVRTERRTMKSGRLSMAAILRRAAPGREEPMQRDEHAPLCGREVCSRSHRRIRLAGPF